MSPRTHLPGRACRLSTCAAALALLLLPRVAVSAVCGNAGNCGTYRSSPTPACWCDDACLTYEDCCADRDTVCGLPTVTSVNPTLVPYAGGVQVTLVGGNFGSAGTLKVGGVTLAAGSIVSWTNAQIVFVAPPGSGSPSLQIANNIVTYLSDGQTGQLSSAYTYYDRCRDPGVADGTSCRTSGPCAVTGATCLAGACQGGSPASLSGCAISNPCQYAANGATCQTGNPCRPNGTCMNASCVPGTPAANGTVCDDGNACTRNDACTSGVCAGITYTCGAHGTCLGDGTCRTFQGCQDGNPCTWDDTCNATGACVAGISYSCNDSNPQTNDFCDGLGGCTRTLVHAAPCAAPNVYPCAAGLTCLDGFCGVPTTTGLQASASPAVFGQSVSFTATITSGIGTPTGTVRFQVDGVNFGNTVTLGGAGTAVSGVTANLSAGSHSITALYLGAAGYGASMTTISLTVGAASTSTLLSSGANPSVTGQSFFLTASVSALAPSLATATGVVQFRVDGVDQGAPVSTSGGVAIRSQPALAVGTHTIIATFIDGTSFAGSSATMTQTVQKANTTTSASSSPSPSVHGQAVTLTATVAAVAPGAGTPTGSVTFTDGATTLGSAPLSAGTATLSAGPLSAGAHSIVATYGGDAGFNGSSKSFTHTVNGGGSTTSLVVAPNPSGFGHSITLTATVGALAPASGQPTGTVTFRDGAATVGTGTLGGGVATLSTSTLDGGIHSLTASYAGNGNFLASTSAPWSQTVNAASTATALSASQNPAFASQPITFTATVTDSSGPVVPIGVVQFQIDGVDHGGPVALTSGIATSAPAPLGAGLHTIGAVFTDGSSFLTSSAPPLTEQVLQGATIALDVRGGVGGSIPAIMAPGEVAGAFPTESWNSLYNASNLLAPSGGLSPLLLGDGSSAAAAVSWTSAFTGIAAGTPDLAGDLRMMRGHLDSPGATSLTVSGLPAVFTARGYQVVPYANSGVAGANRVVRFTVTDGQAAPSGCLNQNTVFAGTHAAVPQGTACNLGPSTPKGTHMVLGGLSGAGFNLTANGVSGDGLHGLLAGVQILANAARPVALAGAPQSVPNGTASATLDGSASYDLNPGQTLLYAWTQTGGPAVTISGADQAHPTVQLPTTLTETTFTFQLVVSDALGIASASSTTTVTTTIAPTTTLVAAAPSPSVFGEPVTFTATVSSAAGTPAGSVQFLVDGNASGAPVPLTSGLAASAPIAVLSVGSHAVDAAFTSSLPSLAGSAGSAFTTVGPAATSLTLTASAPQIVYGQPLSFQATVEPVAPGSTAGGTPTGTVSFFDGATPIGGAALATTGGVTTAVLIAPALGVGPHTIVASYAGDGSFGPASGSTGETVDPIVCGPGSISTGGGTGCAACAPGSVAAAGAASCTMCTAGTRASPDGGSCLACPAGSFSGAGAVACTLCSSCGPGHYATGVCTTTQDTPCSPCSACAAGSFAAGGCAGAADTACAPCSTCGPGTFASVACAATHDVVCATCASCSEGQAATGGCTGAQDTICNGCTVCAAGAHLVNCGGADPGHCITCAAGSVVLPGMSSCTPCPADTAASPGGESCTPCGPGMTSAAGSTTCRACTIGATSPNCTGSCPGDHDCDGTPDGADPAPCDQAIASIAFFPAENTYALLAFEDLWPDNGDLDFNDDNTAYNYALALDGNGNVVGFAATFDVVSIGAGLSNGLFLRVPVPATAIGSTLLELGDGTTRPVDPLPTIDGRPLADAVFKLVDNTRQSYGGEYGFVNTMLDIPARNPNAITLRVRFVLPLPQGAGIDLGDLPFDLFIAQPGAAGHQVHAARYDGSATGADPVWFATRNDGSNLDLRSMGGADNRGRWFVNQRGMPFGLDVPLLIDWPIERISIDRLYPRIVPFALSAGATDTDYYLSLTPDFSWQANQTLGTPPVPPTPQSLAARLFPTIGDQSCE